MPIENNEETFKVNVLLIANYEPDGSESMKRFASILASGLENQPGIAVRTIAPKVCARKVPLMNRELKKWLGQIDKLLIFPHSLKSELLWADIVHVCDHSNAFYTNHIKRRTSVVTCHDVIAIASSLGRIPEHSTRWSGKRLQAMILRGLNQAKHIVCVSEETRAELLSLSDIPESRITVIRNGLNYPYSPMPRAQADTHLSALGLFSNASEFIVHVGGNQWYKNRLAVLRAFHNYLQRSVTKLMKLVMVGKPWTYEMRTFVKESRLDRDVLELSNISNEDVRALYSRAALLLFPSLREGFGWPIIEAQSCGCPVVTSNRAPMTEIAGDAAIFVDPKDINSIADGVVQALQKRVALGARGLINSARFSTKSMVDSYVNLYVRIRASSVVTSDPVQSDICQ